MLQEEKGWALSFNSGLFLAVFCQWLKNLGLRVKEEKTKSKANGKVAG